MIDTYLEDRIVQGLISGKITKEELSKTLKKEEIGLLEKISIVRRWAEQNYEHLAKFANDLTKGFEGETLKRWNHELDEILYDELTCVRLGTSYAKPDFNKVYVLAHFNMQCSKSSQKNDKQA